MSPTHSYQQLTKVPLDCTSCGVIYIQLPLSKGVFWPSRSTYISIRMPYWRRMMIQPIRRSAKGWSRWLMNRLGSLMSLCQVSVFAYISDGTVNVTYMNRLFNQICKWGFQISDSRYGWTMHSLMRIYTLFQNQVQKSKAVSCDLLLFCNVYFKFDPLCKEIRK